MKLFGADTRNPVRWTRADRRRTFARAGISIAWDRNPYGLSGVEVFPLVQPGVFRLSGTPVRTQNGFNEELGYNVDQNPDWTLRTPSGEVVILWEWGNQTVTALDLTNLDARAHWADAIATYFPFCHGVWLDYYSTYVGGQTGEFPPEFWPTWQHGWKDVVSRLRARRSDWTLIGQEWWRAGPLDEFVDGLFFEQEPSAFGKTLAWHDVNTAMDPDDVWEIRHPEAFDPDRLQTLVAWIESRGAHLSIGRDATAGTGLP